MPDCLKRKHHLLQLGSKPWHVQPPLCPSGATGDLARTDAPGPAVTVRGRGAGCKLTGLCLDVQDCAERVYGLAGE